MAIAFDHWEVEYHFLDKGLDTTTRKYKVDAAITAYADVLSAAIALGADLDAVSYAFITGYTIRGVYEEGTVVTPSVDGARVSIDALITGSIQDHPLKSANLSIPAPVEAVFEATSGEGVDIVDAGAAIVENFTDNFVNGAEFTVSDGEQFDDVSPNFKGIRRTKFKRLA